MDPTKTKGDVSAKRYVQEYRKTLKQEALASREFQKSGMPETPIEEVARKFGAPTADAELRNVQNPHTGKMEAWWYVTINPSRLVVGIAQASGKRLKSIVLPVRQLASKPITEG